MPVKSTRKIKKELIIASGMERPKTKFSRNFSEHAAVNKNIPVQSVNSQ
jgi:hypothetical protein